MSTEHGALRVVFAGTPPFAATALEAIAEAKGVELVAVYSQPDRRRGRGKQLSPSPVKAAALDRQLPVYQPVNFKDPEDVAVLSALRADVMVVAAYGLLLPTAVLETPRYGCINIHASLLPRWRGAAPVERAIASGDETTGISIMQMDEGLDTGAVLSMESCVIGPTETGDSLRSTLAPLGAKMIVESLQALRAGPLVGVAQNNAFSSYARKVGKQETELNWAMPAEQIARQIRGFHSAYTCYSNLGNTRIKIANATALDEPHDLPPGTIINSNNAVQVACGEGRLSILELQLPGKRMMAVRDVLNSQSALFEPGLRFDQHP